MTEQEKLIRIDLAEAEIPQPCELHAKRGYQADCEDCDEVDPVPGEIPELKGLFVEIRNPNVMRYGETKELFAARDRETVGQYKERLAIALITAWNIPDIDTSDVLPIPSNDATALDRAVDVVNPIYSAVVKARQKRAIPKGPATS